MYVIFFSFLFILHTKYKYKNNMTYSISYVISWYYVYYI